MINLMKKIILLYLIIILSSTFLLSCNENNQTVSSSVSNNNNQSTNETEFDTSNSETIVQGDSLVIINEFCPINTASVKDKNGRFTSWIELKNISNSDVFLKDYSIKLTSGKNTYSFKLDDTILKSNELRLVAINDYIADDASFYFASFGEIELFNENSSFKLKFSNAKPNHSYSDNKEHIIITPGYETIPEKDQLIINEVMSSNKTYYKQEFCDWIELYNSSNYDIDLSKYYISDDVNNPYKCSLANKTIKAGEYLVLVCKDGELNFNISSLGEDIILTRNDGLLTDSIKTEQIPDNFSYTSENKAERFATPGFKNNYQGYLDYRNSLNCPLVINEVMSSNLSYYPSNNIYYDWIEIKNFSSESIDLSNYFLSNKSDEPTKYQLSKKTLSPGEITVVYASGKGGKHCNFKVSSDYEYLYIFDKEGSCVDSLFAYEIPTNKSYGVSDNELVYFNKPTPNKENTSGYPTISETPVASVESGFYKDIISLKLHGEGELYYTLDGSEPNKDSPLYSGETIIISESTSVRVINYNGDRIPSDVKTFNYFIDLPSYTLPVLKITTTYDDFYGENGIYTQYDKRGLEKKINLAFYVDGIEEFNVDCGLSIAGQGSRVLPKKSMEVKFKAVYGTSKLKYDMFGSEMKEFDTLMLRGGSEDQNRSLFRDEFFTSLIGNSNDMEVWVQDYRPCNLYVNGEYYGIYFIRERLNDHYYASYLDVSEGSLDVIYYWHANEYGMMTDWKKLYKFCEENDLRIKENYEYVINKIDVDNWIDYYIARAYTGDKDLSNIRIFKSSIGDNKWRIVLFDLDWGFTIDKKPFFTHFGNLTQITTNDSTIIYNLLKNDEFKDRFLKRLAMHLENTLSQESVITHLDNITELIRPDIIYESERWGQLTENSWERSINNIKKFIDDGNKTRIQELLEDIEITLELSKEEMEKYFSSLF